MEAPWGLLTIMLVFAQALVNQHVILPRDQTQLSPITGGFFTAEPWAWLIRQVNTQCDQHGRQTLVGSLY